MPKRNSRSRSQLELKKVKACFLTNQIYKLQAGEKGNNIRQRCLSRAAFKCVSFRNTCTSYSMLCISSNGTLNYTGQIILSTSQDNLRLSFLSFPPSQYTWV